MADDYTEDGDSLVQPLPEDNSTPFSPPDESDDSQQVADATGDTDPQELYDEGLPGTVDGPEPNADNSVTDYNPQNDNRTQE